MNKFPVKGTSRQTIWAYARYLRRALGVENELYFNILCFAENILSEQFQNFIFEICEEKELPYHHGETIPSEQKIRIREDVYEGAAKNNGRDRLTIAHEVGHFLMHDEQSVIFCKLDPNGKLPIYNDPDWQADVFAGEILAPSYLIDGMSAQEIHEKCGVSLACAERQLRAIESEKKKGFL